MTPCSNTCEAGAFVPADAYPHATDKTRLQAFPGGADAVSDAALI